MSDPGHYRDPTEHSSQNSSLTSVSNMSISYVHGGGLHFDSDDETKPMIPPKVSEIFFKLVHNSLNTNFDF